MGITKIRKFIKDNKLSFKGTGSDLNGNCVILAGFICFAVEGTGFAEGKYFINELKLPYAALTELMRVYEYAYDAGYGNFWKTDEAKETYTF